MESIAHFLLHCKKYNDKRIKLYENLETKAEITRHNLNEEILLKGTKADKKVNTIIVEETVHFILSTNRFK